VPPSRTSAEACLAGWPNAQPQGWDEHSVAQYLQACLRVCVKCRCCATSLSRNGLRQPACLQPAQSPSEREACIRRAKEGNGGGNWRGLVPRNLTCSALLPLFL